MSESELREWLTRILLEFGSGPIPVSKFQDCEWFQEDGWGVEAFAGFDDQETRVFFTYDDDAGRRFSFTQAGLDFIKGEE
jgi:hypothetical protein